MKKTISMAVLCTCVVLTIFAQNTSITNNNTITIQGNLYYFRPSTTPSSPLPNIGTSSTIDTGSWYGENAAKAWAAISDWVIEHCLAADDPIIPRNGEIVYITSVHVYRGNTPESNKYSLGSTRWIGAASRDGVTIYYWVVSRGAQMENGRSEYRSFAF